jgi:hypothetical protein
MLLLKLLPHLSEILYMYIIMPVKQLSHIEEYVKICTANICAHNM